MTSSKDEQPAGVADKTDPAVYAWAHKLPKLSWAWEFLRRNPQYQADFAAGRGAEVCRSPNGSGAGVWPLLTLIDPAQDARSAAVFWRKEVCASVLPIASAPGAPDDATRTFSLEKVRCRVTVIDDGDLHHVLLSQDGRALQLEVRGPITGAMFLTPALPQSEMAAGRLTAMKRLNDVVSNGILRPRLYPAEVRARRFITLITVLDGLRTDISRRDLAIRIFGRDQVCKNWSDPGNYLRDRLRRAVVRAQMMMECGYRRLLD